MSEELEVTEIKIKCPECNHVNAIPVEVLKKAAFYWTRIIGHCKCGIAMTVDIHVNFGD